MTDQTVHKFGSRLDEYVTAYELERFSVILHGGEPLLYTAEGLARLATQVRSLVRGACHLDFSLQTNGVLLTDQALSALAGAGILISLSLDGPQHVHDRHRLDHREQSTFADTMNALGRLIAAGPEVFSGVIAVIDPSATPREVLEFFAPMELPRLDLLLPDATHSAYPPGRAKDNNCYRRWLEEAFDLWFHEYPSLPIRWFDAVLGSRVGVPSPTDVMGFGRVSLIVIETDGSYTDHDVFKIVGSGGAQLGISVFDTTFSEVAQHQKVHEHGFRLTFDGLSSECKICPVVEACGGGCVMHRAHPERGLDAPTVYCSEMFGLLSRATQILRDSLAAGAGPVERFTGRGPDLVERCRVWRKETEQRAEERVRALGFDRGTASAAVIILPRNCAEVSEAGMVAGEARSVSTWLASIRVQSSDRRLVEPFRNTIRFLPSESAELRHAISSLDLVEACLYAFDPLLPAAMSDARSLLMTSLIPSIMSFCTRFFIISSETVPCYSIVFTHDFRRLGAQGYVKQAVFCMELLSSQVLRDTGQR